MRAKTRKFLEVVSQLEERHVGLQVSRDPSDLTILSMFWRARGLFEGCRLLLHESLPEEALILGRALFTESLRLMELERAGAHRAALVLGWETDSLSHERGLLEEGCRAGIGSAEDLEGARRAIEGRQSDVQHYMALHGIKRVRRFGSEKQLAQQHKRSDDYWTYVLAHQIVHGSETAHMYKTNRIGETYEVYLRSQNQQWMDAVAGFCGRSILHCDRAACAMFGWDEPALVEVLLRQATVLG